MPSRSHLRGGAAMTPDMDLARIDVVLKQVREREFNERRSDDPAYWIEQEMRMLNLYIACYRDRIVELEGNN